MTRGLKASRFALTLCVTATLCATPTFASAQSLDVSEVWYASLLRQRFPTTISNGGSSYALSGISTTPIDITRFNITVSKGSSAISIQGSVTIRGLPDGFSVIDGVNGRQYMLNLDAFIFGPGGHVLWEQHGYPRGGAWIHADGETKQFVLIGARTMHIPRGSTLIVLASGDPVFDPNNMTRVILGAKTVRF